MQIRVPWDLVKVQTLIQQGGRGLGLCISNKFQVLLLLVLLVQDHSVSGEGRKHPLLSLPQQLLQRIVIFCLLFLSLTCESPKEKDHALSHYIPYTSRVPSTK